MSERGTATLGMIVADTVRRNRKMTTTTSTIVSISENSTSATEARIVVVRSVRTRTSMERDSAQRDRRAVLVGDDQAGVVGAREQLVVGADLIVLMRTVEAALRLVDVG